MHLKNQRKAFTMVELVFVIVVIGILSAIAVPKFAATRDDAVVSKAKTVVASVRNAMATEKQKRVLRGNFNAISSLHDAGNAFSVFDGGSDRVLEYSVPTCATRGATKGCWKVLAGPKYQYVMPTSGTVDFNISNNRFDCNTGDTNCKLLTF
jgi:general secretion pathway protein G